MSRVHPALPRRRLLLIAPCLALLLAGVQAAPAPAPVHAEVLQLLGRLQASGCQFNRNGSWHDGAEAQAHLMRKLQALEDKGLVQTTEQFIERGATSSSMSGQAYSVRCGTAAPVASAQWLGVELKALRSHGAAAPAAKAVASR